MGSQKRVACPFCGGTDFWIHEETTWRASFDNEHQKLSAKSYAQNISLIECNNDECPGAIDETLADVTEVINTNEIIYE